MAHFGILSAGGPFLRKTPETFRACKTIFGSSVSKHGEVYTPETSCVKGTSVHIENMRIKQLCNRKVRDFAMALQVRKVSGALEKRAHPLHACSSPVPRIPEWLIIHECH